MIRLKKRNTAWLSALGLLIALALVVGNLTVVMQAVLLGIFAIAMAASLIELGPRRETLIEAITRAPVRRRVSPQASEATERAKARGGYLNPDLTLIDTGLIAVQSGVEGIAMRRTRNVSKDDDGIRPFVTLFVQPEEADRTAVVRFEIYDHYGERKYIHEMKTYLREGEMNIMPDHHLPLAGNDAIGGSGDWDMRVSIDGDLIVMHNFMLSPSDSERLERLGGGQQKSSFVIVDEAEEEIPMSLEDLLMDQESGRARSTRRRHTVYSNNHRRPG